MVLFSTAGVQFPPAYFLVQAGSHLSRLLCVSISNNTLSNDTFEVCTAICIEWRWPRVTWISWSDRRLLRYVGVDFRGVLGYPGALPGPNANNASSNTPDSQYTFQWHCPSLLKSIEAPQHDWFTQWKCLCKCSLEMAISPVLGELRPRNLIQSVSTRNNNSKSEMSARGDALLKKLWSVEHFQWLIS